MEALPKLDRDAFLAHLRQETDTILGQVADAINNAPDGQIIADSECQVRNLFARLRQHTFEAGLQMRIDAAQAAFPPPKNRDTGRPLRDKGPQDYSVLSVNGRVVLTRIRWHDAGQESCTFIDRYLDTAERSISVGVRELACRLNGRSSNFERTAENLAHAAQVFASGETLRTLIEAEGRDVLQAFQDGTLPIT